MFIKFIMRKYYKWNKSGLKMVVKIYLWMSYGDYYRVDYGNIFRILGLV